MRFIEEQLGSIGPVNYVAYFHDSKTGRNTNGFREQAAEVKANVPCCRIDYRMYFKSAKSFILKCLREIEVYPREQQLKEENAESGHPEWKARTEPSVFVLRVESTNVLPDSLLFFDESAAHRVAEAMVHAAELCGSKEPS
jgi:hypothetical protein